MMKVVVWLGLLVPMSALADPNVDVFDSSLQPDYSRSPKAGERQIARDVEIGPAGHIFVALADPDPIANVCANDAVRRINPTFPGVTPPTIADNVRGIQSLGVNATTGMVWVTGSEDCGPLTQSRVFRYQNGGGADGTSAFVPNGLEDIEYLPTGDLFAFSQTDWINYDPTDLSIDSTVGVGPLLPSDPVYHPGTGSVFYTAYGVGTTTGVLRQASILGADQGSTPLTAFGLTDADEVRLFVRGDGRLALAHLTSAPFELQVDTLNAARSAVESSVVLDLSRREAGAVTSDTAGNVYVAGYGARPIDALSVDLLPVTAGAASQVTVTWQTDHDIGPGAVFELDLSDGLDLSGVTDLSVTPLGTLDGTFFVSLTPSTGSEPDRLVIERAGGLTREAGETVGFRIVDIVNPLVETPVAIEDFRVFGAGEFPSDRPMLSALRGDVAPLNAGGPAPDIECEVGQPHDWDLLPGNEICLSPTATVDPTADLQPGSQIDDGVDIGQGAVVGERTIVRAGAFIDRSTVLGPDGDIGAGTVIGRWTTTGPRTVLASDVVIGRNATLGSDNVLPSFSMVGYGAVLGDHATFDAPLALGNLAELGGPAEEGPAIACSGSLTVATRARVATDGSYTLVCEGDAVIGPRTVIGGGSSFGAGTRVRKDGVIGPFFSMESGVRVGRDVNIGSNVTVLESVSIGPHASICSYFTIESDIPRLYSPDCR